MTVLNLINACNNVNIETRIFIEDREGRIYCRGNELLIPEYVLGMEVNSFYIDDIQNQLTILLNK